MSPVSLTQSVDPNVLQVGSIACQSSGATRDNGYWRLFDLDQEFGLFGTITGPVFPA